jgi:hypothetical protein
MILAANIEVVTACLTHWKPVDSCTASHCGVHGPVYEEREAEDDEDETVFGEVDEELVYRATSKIASAMASRSACTINELHPTRWIRGSTYKERGQLVRTVLVKGSSRLT